MTAPIAGILGQSPSMVWLREFLPKVAGSEATVLITGETGTGKERVAESVHALSPRVDAPFVAVNCAALPEHLIESELFGFDRGAFTGALAAHPGRVAEADGGTLFLDEIGEMNQRGQAKLLRFLESGVVDRLGARRPVSVDTRVVAATNVELEELVSAQRFRADLYFRLNVARIELEPLRDRTEDIGVLLQAFLSQFNARYRACVGPPDDELLNSLEHHDWPGNVRELRNMVESIYIDPPVGALKLEHLPLAFRRIIQGHRRTESSERDRMAAALRRTSWNKTQAARILNVSRMTLYRKISKYHLERPATRQSGIREIVPSVTPRDT